jgi:hypothetical protein
MSSLYITVEKYVIFIEGWHKNRFWGDSHRWPETKSSPLPSNMSLLYHTHLVTFYEANMLHFFIIPPDICTSDEYFCYRPSGCPRRRARPCTRSPGCFTANSSSGSPGSSSTLHEANLSLAHGVIIGQSIIMRRTCDVSKIIFYANLIFNLNEHKHAPSRKIYMKCPNVC